MARLDGTLTPVSAEKAKAVVREVIREAARNRGWCSSSEGFLERFTERCKHAYTAQAVVSTFASLSSEYLAPYRECLCRDCQMQYGNGVSRYLPEIKRRCGLD